MWNRVLVTLRKQEGLRGGNDFISNLFLVSTLFLMIQAAHNDLCPVSSHLNEEDFTCHHYLSYEFTKIQLASLLLEISTSPFCNTLSKRIPVSIHLNLTFKTSSCTRALFHKDLRQALTNSFFTNCPSGKLFS